MHYWEYNSDYFTKLFYPRKEFDAKLVEAGRNYFDMLNQKLNLDVYFAITIQLPPNVYGQYKSYGRNYRPIKRFGNILIDVEKHNSIEELFHTIRHEIVHAVCDLRYDTMCGHGERWRRTAKLFRVDTKQYEKT